MLFTKNITFSIANTTDKKNLEISYQGDTKTIKLPDGKSITITFEGNERLLNYSDGTKIQIVKKPTGIIYSDLSKGTPPETFQECIPKTFNNYLKICTFCNECEACVVVCPEGAIEVEDGSVMLIKDCSGPECYVCMDTCPLGAVQPL